MRSWWIGVLAAVPVFVARAWPSLWTTVDDAWISARYAWNAAEGHGLVYSAGEPPIEGYTNLLWTLWLALGHLLGADPQAWMVGSGLGVGALTVGAAGLLTRALSARWWAPGLASLALALDVHHAVVATNGLESGLFVGATLLAAWATFTARGQGGLVALGLGLGALAAVRPEGVAVGGLLLGTRLLAARAPGWLPTPRSAPAELAGMVGALGAVWAGLQGWRWLTYGAWAPNTFAAKATGGLLNNIPANLAYLGMDWPWWAGIGGLGLGALLAHRRDGRALVLGAVGLALLAVSLRVQLWMPAGRLLIPTQALLLCLIAAAPGRLGAALGGALLLGSLAAPFTSVERIVRGYDVRHSVVLPNGASLAGQHLAAHAPPGSWLAVRDAGVLAAFAGTGIRVAELHDRALTQPHPGGAPLDLRATVPRNPEILVMTQARESATTLRYPNDRKVFKRATEPYVYLGRVHQHYHRYYDIYARSDLDIPPLPAEIVVNHKGPAAPAGRPSAAPRP